jgi:hypothetical protein
MHKSMNTRILLHLCSNCIHRDAPIYGDICGPCRNKSDWRPLKRSTSLLDLGMHVVAIASILGSVIWVAYSAWTSGI